jgi:hypothetical protein
MQARRGQERSIATPRLRCRTANAVSAFASASPSECFALSTTLASLTSGPITKGAILVCRPARSRVMTKVIVPSCAFQMETDDRPRGERAVIATLSKPAGTPKLSRT